MKNFVKSTKKYTILFCTVVVVMAVALSAFASFLPPELGDWRLVSEHITELPASEDLGSWTSASYVKTAPASVIEVQVTKGPGPGDLFVPEGIISSDAGPIGFPSTYETVSVAGRRAVLERDDLTGQALAVALETCTVTFEARGISREELFAFAESMAEALQSSK